MSDPFSSSPRVSTPEGSWSDLLIAELAWLDSIAVNDGLYDRGMRCATGHLREWLLEEGLAGMASTAEYVHPDPEAAAPSSISPTPEASCAWTEDDEGVWTTACGEAWVFTEGYPWENKARYCFACGKGLVATRYQEPRDE